jgi:lactose/L-arabinose transport system permease protein
MTGWRRTLSTTALHFFVAAMAFFSIFPFLWMAIGTTNDTADIIKGKWTPGPAFASNVLKFFTQVDAPLVFMNSAKIAFVATCLSIFIASIAGYGFETFPSRVRERIYGAVLLTLAIPFAALLIPLFMMMGRVGLINSHWGAILPSLASGFLVFFFRQATKGFPSELRDAARVDGLKEWQIYLFVYAPVMRSTFAAAFAIAFLASWNSYLWPLVVLQTNETKTIVLVVSSLASAYYPDFGVVMVGAVLATVPTLVVFFAMQRQFVQGVTGAVK